ncbi:MAG TPA: hypothetical protein VN764_16925 [Polyangiaceae bacterium]|nr:hypothetical protein [Polyangiaceae bacterium]
MASSPLSLVKDKFGTKEKLVEAVQKLATDALWIDRVNADKGLARVSNAKLLRLHAALEDAKGRFGSRAKLVDAIRALENRSKDDGYKTRLSAYPLPRLIELHDAAAKRSLAAKKRAAKPAKAAPKKAQPRSKKAQAKAKAK